MTIPGKERAARPSRRGGSSVALLVLVVLLGCKSAPPYAPRYRPKPKVEPPAVHAAPGPREITVEPIAIPQDPPTPVQVEQAEEAPLIVEIDQRIRTAGRPVLPGLTAVRAASREREDELALAAIRRDLEGEHSHLWMTRLVELLSFEEGDSDELWCATARVVGQVGRYDLAPHLLLPLEPRETEGATLRRIASQEALHSLYGRWFSRVEDVQPYLESIEPGRGTRLLLEGGENAEVVARERLFESLRHNPLAAEIWFQDPDPLLRAGVASVIGETLPTAEEDSEDREALLAMVFARIDIELEPRAFHAAVQTIAGSQESSPPEATELVALRAKLTAIVRSSADARTLSVAQAFARMPWKTQGDVDEGHLFTGVARVGAVLERVQAMQVTGEHDSDLMLGVLQSLLVLCDRARGTELESQLRRSPARESVFAILQDVHEDENVRAAAVNALSSFALPEDWELLVTVLDRGDATPALSHALLGALPAILAQFEPEDPGATALLDQVAMLCGADDPDLRRRALRLLHDERVAPMLASMDTDFLVVRLELEEVPDLTRLVLRLLRELGQPEMFPAVLETRRFDGIAAAGPEEIAELAATLQVLADGRADESMQAATRLASVPAPDTEVARTRNALAIVAALDDEAAQELGPEAHRRVCAWAWSLQTDGVPLEGATPQGLDFVHRLVHVHWKESAVGYASADPESSFGEPARHHLLAVAIGVLYVDRVPGNTLIQAEEAFARALKFAPGHSRPNFELQVRRDRARFRAAAGESVKALTDYRELIEVDAIEIPDLRVAIALLTKIGGPTQAGQRAVAPEKFDLLGRIVGRPGWHDELPLVRLQDLRDLSDNALLSRDPERMRRLVEALNGLPAAPVAPGTTDTLVEPSLWDGLTEKAEWLEELRRTHDRVQDVLEKTKKPVPAVQKP